MAQRVIGAEVRGMFESIAPGYDLTNTVLSLGIHHLWKRMVAATLPSGGGSALDLCTGTGDLLPLLRPKFDRVIGADFCYPMLAAGRKHGQSKGLPLIQGDALSLPFASNRFDAVTVAFGVRNLEDLDRGLSEIRRVMKSGARLAVLEFGQPGGLFGAAYRLYSRYGIPLIGRVLTGNGDAYRYLPETAAAFPCGPLFEERLLKNGFRPMRTRALTFGIAYLYLAEAVSA